MFRKNNLISVISNSLVGTAVLDSEQAISDPIRTEISQIKKMRNKNLTWSPFIYLFYLVLCLFMAALKRYGTSYFRFI